MPSLVERTESAPDNVAELMVAEASVTLPLLGTTLGVDEIIASPELAQPLREAMAAFVRVIEGEAK